MTLPVLSLRDFVLFPAVTAPIQAGRPKTLRAIEAALETEDRLVFAVAQRQPSESVTTEDLYTIGTIASIGQIQRGLSGTQLLLEGKRRGIAVRITDNGNFFEATVREAEEMTPLDTEDAAFVALYREARERAAELGQKSGLPNEIVEQVLASVDEPARLADLVAGYTDIPTAQRQVLLETLSVEERIRLVLIHVQRQIEVLDAQEDIKSKVQEELGDRQREMLLREQLKAIQRELGDEETGEEIDDLREALRDLNLPEEARKEVDRELKRLARSNPESMEAQVIRTYLETVAELPWNDRSEDHLDLARASEILDEDHYGLDDVKDRVLEFLAVHKLRQKKLDEQAQDSEAASDADSEAETKAQDGADQAVAEDSDTAPETVEPPISESSTKGSILLFTGPPGVGKTSVAKSIARALNRKYIRIALGGVRDEADVRGHRRTYVGAMAGRIIQGMKQAGTKNPVFLLDEVDKVGASYQGNPASALLEVLDPAQNDSFTDHYLGLPFDLSEVLFVCTANFVQNIPSPLLDRMEIVEFSGYTEGEKLEIAKRYLVPRQILENGLEEAQVSFVDDSLADAISRYTREAGVRQLERTIGKICRKIARKVAGGQIEQMDVDAATVAELLGRPKVHPEVRQNEDQVGIATGMYYTPVGGDIMFVEVSTMPGKGELVLTGQLGDVMKESARAAWTYAKSNAASFGIPDEAFQGDLHVHVPAGAIPKDGPSAGVTMATALVSALSGAPIASDLAMTGEITLSGRVLPIGGVKEKVLGAIRAGITEILLPKANEADLEDLPQDARDKIKVHPAEQLDEVLALAIRGARFENGRLLLTETLGEKALDETGERLHN